MRSFFLFKLFEACPLLPLPERVQFILQSLSSFFFQLVICVLARPYEYIYIYICTVYWCFLCVCLFSQCVRLPVFVCMCICVCRLIGRLVKIKSR